MRKPRKTDTWPVVALRDMVVFPHARVPFVVGRAASIEAVDRALEARREVFLVMQRDAEVKEPAPRDLHAVGTIGRVIHDLKLPDGNYKLLVEGLVRGRMTSATREEGPLAARGGPVPPPQQPSAAQHAARARLLAAVEELVKAQGGAGLESVSAVLHGEDLDRGCDELAARLNVSSREKQELLEAADVVERCSKLEMLLRLEMDK